MDWIKGRWFVENYFFFFKKKVSSGMKCRLESDLYGHTEISYQRLEWISLLEAS